MTTPQETPQAEPLTATGYLARGICTTNGGFSTSPNEQAWFSRALPLDRTIISANDEDKQIYNLAMNLPNLVTSDLADGWCAPYSMLAAHSRFLNTAWVVTFWAVKSPIAQCRLRMSYVETGHVNTDGRRRRPAVEWDLAASDTCEMIIKPSYYFDYKYSARSPLPVGIGVDVPTGGTAKAAKQQIPKEDTTFGTIKMEIISRYCPGGLFPDSFVIYTFMRPLNMVFNTPVDCEALLHVCNGLRYS